MRVSLLRLMMSAGISVGNGLAYQSLMICHWRVLIETPSFLNFAKRISGALACYLLIENLWLLEVLLVGHFFDFFICNRFITFKWCLYHLNIKSIVWLWFSSQRDLFGLRRQLLRMAMHQTLLTHHPILDGKHHLL